MAAGNVSAMRPVHAGVRHGLRRTGAESGGHAEYRRITLARMLLVSSSILLVLAGLLLAAAHLAGARIAHGGNSPETTPLEIVIGNDLLIVPANLIRFGPQRRPGAAQRIDLFAHWPEMTGYSERLRDSFVAPTVSSSIIFLTVEPRAMSQDMSGRMDSIYTKFLVGAEAEAGNGLRRRLLSADSGFEGEELFYEANSPYPFVTRCMAEGKTGPTSRYCLRDLHIGRDLMVTYRFHQDLLPQWMMIEKAVLAMTREWLGQ